MQPCMRSNRKHHIQRQICLLYTSTAVLEGEYADVTYKDTVSTLKTAYDEAADTLADLKEEQSALLTLDNGTITAEYDGTIASVSYDAGDILNLSLIHI